MNRSSKTLRTYAHNLKLYWEYLERYCIAWNSITLEQLSEFIHWLRRPEYDLKVVSIESQTAKRREPTINNIMSTVCQFIDYHQRLDNIESDIDTTVERPPTARKFKDLLYHINKSKPFEGRFLRVKEPKTFPGCLTTEQVKTLINACNNRREKLLISLLYESGIRIGEALGLRHEDIISNGKCNQIKIVSRANNHAVAREAQVSTSYLYKYPELKYRIIKLREEQRRSGKRVIPAASDNSKKRITGHLKKRIQDLDEEITQLRKANESLAGRVFELETYESVVNRFREENQRLLQEIERLTDENSELRHKLALHNLAPTKKVTYIKGKRTKIPPRPIPDSVKTELANLDIKINSTLRKLIRQNPEEIALESIEALKYALSNQEVKNPARWLAEGIKNRWKKSDNPIQPVQNGQSVEDLVFPEGFEEWYIQAIDAGFIINESPAGLPKNTKGELLVKVNRPTASGFPFSLVSWLEAKKIMEIELQ